MCLLTNLHSPITQQHNSICSTNKCLTNKIENNWFSSIKDHCKTQVKELEIQVKNLILKRTVLTKHKPTRSDYKEKHDRVPPFPQVKRFKLLKVVAIVSSGILIGDLIGKTFQDSMLDLRDELWHICDE